LLLSQIPRPAKLQGEDTDMDQILIEKPCTNSAELSSNLDETSPLKVRKKRSGEFCPPDPDPGCQISS
jgi:hypothetical protein